MTSVRHFLPVAITLALAAGCPDVGADEADATDSGTDSGEGDEDAGDGDGDGGDGDGDGDEGDGDGDGDVADRVYIEVGFTLDDPFGPPEIRSIGVLDVTDPGAAPSSATILEAAAPIHRLRSTPDGSRMVYGVGYGTSKRLFVHDYASDPFAPAIEVQGLPIADNIVTFAANGSGLGVLTREDDTPLFARAYYVPWTADSPGVATLVHELEGEMYHPTLSDDGQLFFVAAAPWGEPMQLYASEVGSGTPSALVQITDLPAGELRAYRPEIFVDDVAFFLLLGNGGNTRRQLMRLSLADWPSFEVDPVTAYNPAPDQFMHVSDDGTRVLHAYGEEFDSYAMEVVTIVDGVIGDPLAIDVVAADPGSLSPSGRYASFNAIGDTPEVYDVAITDLEGPNPETPVVVGTTSTENLLSDRWIVWMSPDNAIHAASLVGGIGSSMALTNPGSASDLLFLFDDQRLYYVGGAGSYWSIDLGGDTPGMPELVNHSLPQGEKVFSLGLLRSPIDGRVFYRSYDGLDGYTERLWMNDPALEGAEVELASWNAQLSVWLIAPGWGTAKGY